MLQVILKRIAIAVPVLLIVASLTFFLVRMAPGGPFDADKVVPPQVMKNLKSVLAAANSSLENVVFVRVYLLNFEEFEEMNLVYESYFKPNKLPARTCVGVTGLAVGASVEIDLIAKT